MLNDCYQFQIWVGDIDSLSSTFSWSQGFFHLFHMIFWIAYWAITCCCCQNVYRQALQLCRVTPKQPMSGSRTPVQSRPPSATPGHPTTINENEVWSYSMCKITTKTYLCLCSGLLNYDLTAQCCPARSYSPPYGLFIDSTFLVFNLILSILRSFVSVTVLALWGRTVTM